MLFRTLSILSLNNFNELTYNFQDLNNLLHTCARNSQSLQTVSLTKLSQTISAGSIKSISTACSSLTSLNLSACTISDGSFIETLASSGLALKQVTLSKLEGINDDDFHCLLSCPSHSLSSLDLSHSCASNLTFQALSLPSNKLVLENLNLASTPLKFNALTRISENLASTLKILDIRSCHLLDRGSNLLSFLTSKENLPNLTELSVTLYILSEEFDFSDEEQDTAEAEQPPGTLAFPPASQPQPAFPASLLFDELSTWTCPHCTLINEDADDRCAACFGKRRISTLPPPISNLPSPVKKRPKFNLAPITAPLQKLTIDLRIDDEVRRKRKVNIEYGEERRVPGSPLRTPPRGYRSHQQEEAATPATPDPVSISTAASKFFADLCANTNSSLEELAMVLCEESAAESASGEDQWHHRQEPVTTSFNLTLPVAESLTTKSPNLKSLKFDGVKVPSPEPFFVLLQLEKLSSITLTCDEEMGEGCDVPCLLRAISEKGADLNLDNLQFIIRNHQKVTAHAQTLLTSRLLAANALENQEATLFCPTLEKLWIDGCPKTEKLILECANLQRLHISNLNSLLYLKFPHEFSNLLRDLRLSRNPSLLPQCISSLKLPALRRLEIYKMTGLNDVQVGELISQSIHSLISLRLKKCHGLGDVSYWLRNSGFRPLCVVDLFKPSPAFDLNALQYLLNNAYDLRDLNIEYGEGLEGTICNKMDMFSQESPNDLNTTVVSNISLDDAVSHTKSTLGCGAMDETGGEGDDAEHLGVRGIQRTLHHFVNNASFQQEYGFPPTLSSYQRKIVHEVAENLELEHESVRMKNGVKIVKVKRKRRERIGGGGGETTAASPPVQVGSLGAQLEQYQTQTNPNSVADYTGTGSMGSMWDSGPTDTSITALEPPEPLQRKESTVNFNIDDVEEFSDGDDDVFKLDEEEEDGLVEQTSSPPHSMSRRASRKAEKERRRRKSCDWEDPPPKSMEETSPEGEEKVPLPRKKERNPKNAKKKISSYDKNLQCEPPPDVDAKFLRRLTAISHQLPRENGKIICISNIRGLCGNKNCKFWHADMKKAAQLKKFGPLIDFVCRCTVVSKDFESPAKSNSSRKSPINTPRSYGSAESDSYMEKYMGSGGSYGSYGSGKKKLVGGILSHSPKSPSEMEGIVGSNLGTSPSLAGWSGPTKGRARLQPLHCKFLLSLTLVGCEGLKAVLLDAPVLARFAARGCVGLEAVDVDAPQLNTFDVSDCVSLERVGLFEKSMRGLRVAKLTGCKLLNESFVQKLVNHCKALRQLHIYGSGASAVSTRQQRKIKTKKGLDKIIKQHPKLEIVTTKDQMKRAFKKEIGGGGEKERDFQGLMTP
ncbi:hypothetical protein TL16_g09710 [Triparma laevis f. inornata]|uniref:R3H domain-containing protein n=1 Tax=Triparma laevis f. inornata TaxID=1714386 RepID=A0A9W7BBJ3_9STRA|nr:hypothetical protein TL16_g09710 [Triparma laevis f. inornata]